MRSRSSRGIVPAVVALLIAACADDATGPPEGGVAGNWTVSYTDDATGCGEGVTAGIVNVLIAQNGNVLTVTSDGIVFTGTLNGTEATWSGSYPEDGGTTSEQFTVTFANNNAVGYPGCYLGHSGFGGARLRRLAHCWLSRCRKIPRRCRWRLDDRGRRRPRSVGFHRQW